ncbi:MAG: glycosyltransferase family A protein [Verrucomicrobiota bacterium]|nr:glycosyltransferase family A protein [Verrucomicrobiota bacterium]
MTDSISVIIPTYNYGALLPAAIESVRLQTEPAGEVIVVDDGSTDGTERLVRDQFPDVRYIRQENAGVAVARNRGVQEASGKFVAFLDPDDLWFPWKLQFQKEFLNRERAVFAASDAVYFSGEAPIPTQPQSGVKVDWFSFQDLYLKNRITTSTVVCSREEFLSLGGFDSRYKGTEDYDLWLRWAKRGPLPVQHTETTAYRVHEGSLSHRLESMEEQVLRILEEHASLKPTVGILTRRKAEAYLMFQTAWQYSIQGDMHKTCSKLIQSYSRYPWPMGNLTKNCFARSRLFLAAWRRLIFGRTLAKHEN